MKSLIKLFLGSVFCLCIVSDSYSQVTGPNPSSINWKSIDTEHVKVIFPEGNVQQANRIASLINYISNNTGNTVGQKRKHLELVLQTNQVISNGYVSLAPFRSEFYATPLQDFNILGTVSWLDLLSLHEYRHAMQMSNTKVGLTKFAYIFGGESIWGILQAFSVPNWYLEGDAVQTETVLSEAGRGRTPAFFELQRSMLLNDIKYSYRKAWLGSFRDWVPDHYNLGYSILHEVRNENDPTVWAKILREGAGYKGVFYSFSKAMKRNTGYNASDTYDYAYDKLKAKWSKELDDIELIPVSRVTPRANKFVTHYSWAHPMDDGSIIAVKNSFAKTAEIVRINEGKEASLVTLGHQVFEPIISVNNDKIAWTDLSRDPRWDNKNFNDVRGYDIETGKVFDIATKTRYFAPQFSAKGDRIVAAKSDEQLNNSIVILSSETGEEVGSVPNPENDFIAMPRWTNNDDGIVFLANRNGSVSMMKYQFSNNETIRLTDWSKHVIGGITVGEDQVFYEASYTGINNIFAVSLSGDKNVKQVSSVEYGARKPAISGDGQTLYFSQLDPMGFGIYEQDLTSAEFADISIIEPVMQDRYDIKTTESENNILGKVAEESYEVSDFDGLLHSPKLHSWSFGASTDQDQIDITVQINNSLNDFGASIGYGYNYNEQTNVFSGRIDYSRFYIPFNFHGELNGRNRLVPTNLTNTGTYDSNEFRYSETKFGGGISLPLTWYNGIYTTGLSISSNLDVITTSDYKLGDTDLVTELDLTAFEVSVDFSNLRQKAHQNVGTRFGQELSAYYGTSVSGASANKLRVEAGLYLPGLFPNQSIYLRGGYIQEELTNEYRFLDEFSHARGYIPILGDEEYIISANYHFPLFYPERGIPGVSYVKRIRGNIFGDYSQITRTGIDETFSQNSAGVELIFDTILFHTIPISIGLRYSNLFDQDYFDDQSTNIGIFVELLGF